MRFFEYSGGIIHENSIAADHTIGILYLPNEVAGTTMASLSGHGLLLLCAGGRVHTTVFAFAPSAIPANGPSRTLLCVVNIAPEDS